MSDHHIHHDPAVRALVERAKARTLREAAEEYSVAYRRASAEAMAEVYDFLHARADSLAAQPVTSVEPGCTCDGMAACPQCQERDAAQPSPEAATVEEVVTKNDAAHPFVPIVRRAVLQWKRSGGDVSVVIAQALADEHREAAARAWDEGWDDRDNDSSEPYSPHKVNPYHHIPPEPTGEKP